MIPIRTDSPLRSTPWTNWALIAANVLVFAADKTHLFNSDRWALFASDPHLLNYFTYQFLHADGMHIAGNMLFLFIFGNNVNDRMGNWGYLAFYLAGGVFAGITFVLLSGPMGAPVIGASGAVSAVTGAYLVLLPMSHITVVYFFFFIGLFEVPSVYLVIFYFLLDFVYGFAGFSSDMGGGVAHTAHIGGSLFGFGVSFALLSLHLLPRDVFDLFALFQRWNRRRQYRDLVRQGFDPFSPTSQVGGAPNPNQGRIQDLRAQIGDAIGEQRIEDAAKLYLELHAIDPQQVLARQNQLDVANQLFAQDIHPAAADAYEGFLRNYPKYDQIEHVQLMLGLLYARYLNRPDLARQQLQASLQRLKSDREIEIAKSELARMATA